MNRYSLLFAATFFSCTIAFSQVAINTTNTPPDSTAMLDISSTSKGLLIPRLTTAQRNSITGIAKGLTVYDSTTNSFWYHNGTTWGELSAENANLWRPNAAGMNAAVSKVGIGTSNPITPLHIQSSDFLTMINSSNNINGTIFRLSNTSSGGMLWDFISTGALNGAGPGTLLIRAASATAELSFKSNGTMGIGTIYPDASARLDLTAFDKGLLVPRVNLSGTNDIATIVSPATSLLVYNQATAGSGATAVRPGFYYWAGSAWASLLGSTTLTEQTWLRSGNAGTTDGSNFIGTTDNVPFTVRVNNERAGRLESDIWTANTFWGYTAGKSNTGVYNTGVGYTVLSVNQGSFNTAVGRFALRLNTTGGSNTVVGTNAMAANTIGSSNIAVGFAAMAGNTMGNSNTAVGNSALNSNSSGYHNVTMGEGSLSMNTTGFNNTVIGSYASQGNTTGSENTIVGAYANVSANNLTNATAIGSQAIVNASNKIRLGNTAVTVIEGQVPFSSPSDMRFKYNVRPNVPGLDFITRLTPVTYYLDEDKLARFAETGVIENSQVKTAAYHHDKVLHTGFLAQDVEKIASELGYRFDGVYAPANSKEYYSLAYSQFVVPLVKAVQEQQQLINELKKDTDTQQKEIELLKQQVKALLEKVK